MRRAAAALHGGPPRPRACFTLLYTTVAGYGHSRKDDGAKSPSEKSRRSTSPKGVAVQRLQCASTCGNHAHAAVDEPVAQNDAEGGHGDNVSRAWRASASTTVAGYANSRKDDGAELAPNRRSRSPKEAANTFFILRAPQNADCLNPPVLTALEG